ncbi:MAG: hypothetical protein WDA04_04185 [Anaerolineaceae bacterium]|jgi:hypothetical protein|nr:hypothetical protein [Anaerolineaceae bacterium]
MNHREIVLMLVFFLVVPLGGCDVPEPIFADDFSDASSGWEVFDNSLTSANYVEGSYRISLLQKNKEKWVLANQDFGDVAIEVDATYMGGTADNSFGVVCKFQDIKQYYAVVISSDGAYMIQKRVGGSYQRLTGEYFQLSEQIKPGTMVNRLRVECGQDYLALYVNKELINRVEDNSYTQGDVGLIVTTYGEPGLTVSFDNFEVYPLP